MKIWVHRYQLEPVDRRFKSRAGALVKVEWAQGQSGFSDLHPWPEYGEELLEVHLDSLAKVKFTSLAANSLEFNYIDREYRLTKRNAFAGLILPRTHRLVTDIKVLEPQTLQGWQSAGFSHIKVKMGNDLVKETQALVQLAYATNLMWRLDFNGSLSATEFTAWWKNLGEAVHRRIDLVEDPTAGEKAGEGLKILGPWANDWHQQNQAQIRILKPARESAEVLAKYSRLIFTHGMDHPLGQACAIWAAARFYAAHPKKTDVCGLGASSLYQTDAFSEAWHCEGPRLKATPGTGFGFDEILSGLEWERLL